jgi:hypothetical protein
MLLKSIINYIGTYRSFGGGGRKSQIIRKFSPLVFNILAPRIWITSVYWALECQIALVRLCIDNVLTFRHRASPV